jgi:hypothetical protein
MGGSAEGRPTVGERLRTTVGVALVVSISTRTPKMPKSKTSNPFFFSKRQLRRPFHDTTPLANESVRSDTDRIFHCGAALKASVSARTP